MTSDFKIATGAGTARPVFPSLDMLPAVLDDALGATQARKAYEAANAHGEKMSRVYTDNRDAWRHANPERDYADRGEWVRLCALHTRDDEAAVAAAEKAATAALRNYHRAQRAGLVDRTVVADAYLDADLRAAEALRDLRSAISSREGLMRFLVKPEAHASRNGRGHFNHSSAIAGEMKTSGGAYALDCLEVIVAVAPRELVRELIAK